MNIVDLSLLLASKASGFREILLPTLGIAALVLCLLATYYFKYHLRRQPIKNRNWLFRIVYAAFLVAIVVLSMTSFGSILRMGVMQHYALLAHMSAAGAFVFLLLPVSCIYLPSSLRVSRTWWLESCSAWVLVIGSLTTAASMMIGMLPAMNTAALLQLTEVHRYAGLTAAVAAVAHVSSLLLQRMGTR